jgi:hypothetical protein
MRLLAWSTLTADVTTLRTRTTTLLRIRISSRSSLLVVAFVASIFDD